MPHCNSRPTNGRTVPVLSVNGDHVRFYRPARILEFVKNLRIKQTPDGFQFLPNRTRRIRVEVSGEIGHPQSAYDTSFFQRDGIRKVRGELPEMKPRGWRRYPNVNR